MLWPLLFDVSGCDDSPHYIGDVCPGAAVGSNGCVTFAAGLDVSGVSKLPTNLAVPGAAIPPVERLRGETAVDAVWTADVGGELRGGNGARRLDLEAPFTDDTRAVGLATGTSSYVATTSATADVGADDFAIELVLRAAAGATLFEKRAGTAGWLLRERDDGALVLSVADSAQASPTELASEPLVEGAWYHCLAWVSRAQGGRIDCNGRPGEVVSLSTLGTLAVSSPLAAGGGTANGQIALMVLYRAPLGGLGPAAAWHAVGAQRFAALAGAGAVALGDPLPRANLRDSPAYLDMQRAAGAPRRLFLVGADWPRVACRTDSMNARDCGYISEPARKRLVPGDPAAFAASEVTVAPNAAAFVDGEMRMAALIPSTATALHAITATSTFDAAHHVFSFFAHAGNASRVGVSAGGLPTAVYDLAAGKVASAPAGVDASIEAWGDGVFRCAYGFDARPGPTTYSLQVGDPSATAAIDAPFAGDGSSAALFLTGLQVDIGLRAPGSLLAADVQAPDHLVFAAGRGNVPARPSISFTMRLIAPAGARATDQPILDLNRAGLSEDQVQLFAAGQSGRLEYVGRSSGVTRWHIEHQTPLTDGQRRVLDASWKSASAEVAMNGEVAAAPTLTQDSRPFVFDQIDVAFSPGTSDHLEGLVAGIAFSIP